MYIYNYIYATSSHELCENDVPSQKLKGGVESWNPSPRIEMYYLNRFLTSAKKVSHILVYSKHSILQF